MIPNKKWQFANNCQGGRGSLTLWCKPPITTTFFDAFLRKGMFLRRDSNYQRFVEEESEEISVRSQDTRLSCQKPRNPQRPKSWQICRMKINFNFEARNLGLGFEVGIYVHSTNLPTFLALQGVLAQKLIFISMLISIFILQIYQHFWLYKGSELEIEFIFILQIYQHFWLYKGFQASKLNSIFILQIYQLFWIYKGFLV